MTDQKINLGASSSRGCNGDPVEIRPFPYPYKAALAICNDLDDIRSFAEMKAIHDVLNGRKMTSCGPGLGLEIGDSFHFYSVHPQHDDTLSYFEGISDTSSAAAPALREGIASGLLDTMHTWGNFSQKGGFIRQHAQRAVEELDRYNLTIPVWTNHGDIHNFQNIGRHDRLGDIPEIRSGYGDSSSVLEYHTDLMLQTGVRYVWIKDVTDVVGQERSLDFKDWLQSGKFLFRISVRGLLRPEAFNPKFPCLYIANNLIRPGVLRDGRTVYEILRYGYWDKAGNNHLPELLSLQVLMRLTELGGAMLIYIHLGKGRPSLERPFSKASYQALTRLAEWAHSGDVWVTTPSRLCRYIELRQRLRLLSATRGTETVIHGEFKPVSDLSDPEIAGLSFYHSSAQSCAVIINNNRYETIRNPAEANGKISFSIPLQPLEYCWD